MWKAVLVLVWLGLCTSLWAGEGGKRKAAAVAENDAGPEPQLARILGEIDKNRLSAAMEQTDALIQRYPNFRLAHLIKGDLLLARSRPISTFGNATDAPPQQLADLREEAIARLRAYKDKSSAARYVPRYLLQLRPDQQFAIVVDTDKARLYLYRNEDGRPRFAADYYITHGKQGSDKLRKGDRKTPVGVYHVTSSLPPDSLDKFYGSGAFPVNYPNDWDKQQGRDGGGIWLHGTPPDTYSRPPKASDGCVILSNADLNRIGKNLQLGVTPVIISNSIEWLSYDDWQSEREDLNRRIEEWRSDLESGLYDLVIRHYARDFKATGQTGKMFSHLKSLKMPEKERFKVELDKLSIFRNPGKEQMVVVSFEQDLRSKSMSSQTRKNQYWIREGGTWKIIYEGNT